MFYSYELFNIKNMIFCCFSPIKNKEKLIEAVKYVAEQAKALAKKIVGKSFPIESLTIFSHSEEEFEVLKKIQAQIGEFYNENNGPRVALHEPIVAEENQIKYLRIRQPIWNVRRLAVMILKPIIPHLKISIFRCPPKI